MTRPTIASRASDRLPGWSFAVGAMVVWQIGSAASTGLFAAVGVAGTAWLRLTIAALILIAINRPRVRGRSPSELAAAVAFGAAIAGMTITFLAALDRIPLGTAVALGFMGPLTLAVLGTRSVGGLIWPVLAVLGVLALTQPWAGPVDAVGIAFALGNALCWALYILMSARVGGTFAGVEGLALTVPIAAVIMAVPGIPEAAGGITPGVLVVATVIALFVAVIPYSLDMMALRRISTAAFGTISAIQPALGALVGLIVLGQIPPATSLVGTVLVVIAGVGAMRAEAARHAERLLAQQAAVSV